MFVVMQMEKLRAGDRRKAARGFVIGFALEFERAKEVARQT